MFQIIRNKTKKKILILGGLALLFFGLLTDAALAEQIQGSKPVTIHGRIYDITVGNNISGASICAYNKKGKSQGCTTSNSNSSPNENYTLTFKGKDATFTFKGTASGYAPQTKTLAVKPGNTYTLNFELTPQAGVNHPPQLGSITPADSSIDAEKSVIFTTTFSDADGYANLKNTYLLINTSSSASNSFYARYDQDNNKFYLRDDADTAWLGGYLPGSFTTTIIENSAAKLDCSKTSVTISGNTLTIKWQVSFKSGFGGVKKIYLEADDDAAASTGRIEKGGICIFRTPIPPP